MSTIVEILIDNSNSMGDFKEEGKTYLLPDGSTRMSIAKKTIVDQILPTLDYASEVNIRTFHSAKSNDDELVLADVHTGVFNKEEIAAKLSKLPDPESTGGTPITAAIKAVIAKLSIHKNADRKIILVTDGQETGKGNYEVAAEEAMKQEGIACNIFIVGISQDEGAKQKAKHLAIATGGEHINLSLKNYDFAQVKKVFEPVANRLRSTSLKNVSSIIESKLNIAKAIEKGIVLPTATVPMQSSNQLQKQVIQKDSTSAGKGNASQYNLLLTEVVKSNSDAIALIGKQLGNVAEVLEGLRLRLDDDDDEVVVKENEELNKRVGVSSESFLYEYLQNKFGQRVKWINENGESGNSYDFEVLDIDQSKEYYIECKASMYDDRIFFMTKNEWEFFLQHKSRYQLYYISEALTIPSVTKIHNLFESLLSGDVVPYTGKNIKLKAERAVFQILK